MPPHNDTIEAIAAAAAAFPINATTTTHNTGGFVHGTMVNPTITDPLYRAYTTDHITIDETPLTTTNWTIPKLVTQDDLEKVIHKIYQIIEDHTTLDIPEEEFMRLIKDED